MHAGGEACRFRGVSDELQVTHLNANDSKATLLLLR
jgi:hypothetical protein